MDAFSKKLGKIGKPATGGRRYDKRTRDRKCTGQECVLGAGGKKKVTTHGSRHVDRDGKPLCQNCADKAKERGEVVIEVMD